MLFTLDLIGSYQRTHTVPLPEPVLPIRELKSRMVGSLLKPVMQEVVKEEFEHSDSYIFHFQAIMPCL